jgi:hypothetical protein
VGEIRFYGIRVINGTQDYTMISWLHTIEYHNVKDNEFVLLCYSATGLTTFSLSLIGLSRISVPGHVIKIAFTNRNYDI